MKNKKEKRKRGFTLIELLAVIIILGILLVIAIPSVTKYITGSRKSSYISSAKSIISGVSKIANSETLGMTDQNTTYYIPAKYVKTENNNKSPYGEFTEAYVGVILNDKGYRYYWISNDTSKQGIKLVTEKDKLEEDLIEKDLIDEEIRETVETTGIEDRTKILILNLDGTWQVERVATHILNEDGELEPVDNLLAIFVTGGEFNAKVKTLAGDTNPSYNTQNTNILHIKKSKAEPGEENKQSQNIISANNSEVPIYAWFDNGTIYWWSEDIKPNLNSDPRRMFTNFLVVKDIEFKYIKTNLSTDMSSMFGNCPRLETLDLSTFDTSKVTTMRNMFANISGFNSKLKEIKGLEKFNTANVTDMSYMFLGQNKIQQLNIQNFNTSKVTNMQSMFNSMESIEKLEIFNFDTSKVTNMLGMFRGVKKVKKLNLQNFNTSKVTDMSGMFHSMESLEELDLSGFDTGKVTNMSSMFSCGDTSLNCNLIKIKGLNHFNTSNVTNMTGMFNNQRKIKSLDLSSFNTSKVTSMNSMFQLTESLEELNLSSFDTSNVTDMSYMFGCGILVPTCKLQKITGLTNFNTHKVTNMSYMFVGQQKLRTLDFSSFNTPVLSKTEGMFLGTNLTTIYASSNFDVSNVTSSTNMFSKSGLGITSNTSYVLTGGAGTAYSDSHTDKEYARIDDPANGRPGYFTLKAN